MRSAKYGSTGSAIALACAAALGMCVSSAHATTYTYDGNGSVLNDGAWDDPFVWNLDSGIPNVAGDVAVIPANTVATAHVVGFNSPNTTFTVGKINEGAINPGDANALQARTIGVTGSNNTLIFDSGTVGVPAEINILGNFAGATGVSNPYAFRTKQVLNSDLLVTVQPRNGNPDGSQIVINFLGADSTFSGPGGIIKDGQGTLAFADTAKAFEGPTLVKLGRLRFNDASSQAGGFTKTSAVTVLAGGQFAFDQANVAGKNTFGEALAVRPVVTLNGDGIPTFGGAIRVTTGRITVMDNPVVLASDSSIGIISSATDLTAKLTLPQVISGPGALIKESLNGPGSATLLLTAANTYLGGTVVNAGTLTLSGAGTLGATTGKLTVNSVNTNGAAGQTATVNLNPGFATTVGSLSGTATAGNTAVINNPVGLTVNQTVSGTYNGAIAGNGGITLGNLSTGTLTLTGNLTYAGSTTVQAGTLNLPKLRTTDVVSITGGTLQIAHSAPAGANPESGDNNFVSRPTSLAISNNGAAPQLRVYDGALDLTNNDLIVDYSGASPIADVEDMVRAGYNGGNWLGKGITSSTAANPASNGLLVLGLSDNADRPVASQFTTFDGQVVDTTTIFVKFTHRADVNIDGVVNVNDSFIFNGSYNEAAPLARWATGDQNYDGKYTINDSFLFNGAYNEALASLPEPASLSLLGLAGLAMGRRRRRA